MNFAENVHKEIVQNMLSLFVSFRVKLQVPFCLKISQANKPQINDAGNSVMGKKLFISLRMGRKKVGKCVLIWCRELVGPMQKIELILHLNLSNLSLSVLLLFNKKDFGQNMTMNEKTFLTGTYI